MCSWMFFTFLWFNGEIQTLEPCGLAAFPRCRHVACQISLTSPSLTQQLLSRSSMRKIIRMCWFMKLGLFSSPLFLIIVLLWLNTRCLWVFFGYRVWGLVPEPREAERSGGRWEPANIHNQLWPAVPWMQTVFSISGLRWLVCSIEQPAPRWSRKHKRCMFGDELLCAMGMPATKEFAEMCGVKAPNVSMLSTAQKADASKSCRHCMFLFWCCKPMSGWRQHILNALTRNLELYEFGLLCPDRVVWLAMGWTSHVAASSFLRCGCMFILYLSPGSFNYDSQALLCLEKKIT